MQSHVLEEKLVTNAVQGCLGVRDSRFLLNQLNNIIHVANCHLCGQEDNVHRYGDIT